MLTVEKSLGDSQIVETWKTSETLRSVLVNNIEKYVLHCSWENKLAS